MIYKQIYTGVFLQRPNRFVARVIVQDEEELVHVKNTGRCKELLIPGAKIFLEKSDNPNRKTRFSLIAVYKDDILVNMDSQVPNTVVYQGILSGQINGFQGLNHLKREQTFGHSRFDMYYETEDAKGYIEVKGVTLENNGIAQFPDAPTSRGTKHVRELILAQDQGYSNYIVFLIQMAPVHLFKPNTPRDPAFAEALIEAQSAGVKIICMTSHVTENSIDLLKEIPYDLT